MLREGGGGKIGVHLGLRSSVPSIFPTNPFALILKEPLKMKRTKDWKMRVKELETETYAIYLAYKDPRVPWYAKILIAFVVAHTFSPIDLIPDFIPIIGYLDDLLITPIGIFLALKMIPPEVMAECRENAYRDFAQDQPNRRVAAAVIITTWFLFAAIAVAIAVKIINN
jgi:uncharacterized membrane protein YkvA (DUF1232 family)